MLLFLIFPLVLLPGLFWLYHFYLQDRKQPEPLSLVLLAFGLGGLMVAPTGLLEFYLGQLVDPERQLNIFLLLGLLEESFKLLPVLIYFYPRDEFDEAVDGIIYSVAAGLGFAVVENMLYTLVYGLQTGLLRSLITTLAHAGFSGIAGFFLGRALLTVKWERALFLILTGLLVAGTMHGVYNYLLFMDYLASGLLVGVIFLLYLFLVSLIRLAIYR